MVFACVILCFAVSVEHWTCERQTQYYGIYHVSMVSHSKNSGFVLYSTVCLFMCCIFLNGGVVIFASPGWLTPVSLNWHFYLPYSAHPLKLVVAVKNKSVTVSQV